MNNKIEAITKCNTPTPQDVSYILNYFSNEIVRLKCQFSDDVTAIQKRYADELALLKQLCQKQKETIDVLLAASSECGHGDNKRCDLGDARQAAMASFKPPEELIKEVDLPTLDDIRSLRLSTPNGESIEEYLEKLRDGRCNSPP